MKTVGTAKRGYPVYEKMTMFDESGKETDSMVNEVVELSKATLEAGLFDIPAGYREVERRRADVQRRETLRTMGNSSSSSSMGRPSSSSGIFAERRRISRRATTRRSRRQWAPKKREL